MVEKVEVFWGSDKDFEDAKKEFPDRVSVEALYNRYHLTPELITKDVEKLLKTLSRI